MVTDLSKLTRNQKMVFDSLSHAGTPMSAYDILDGLRSEGLRAPLQVYRALGKLVELGAVHKIESINAFVACAQQGGCDRSITSFAICESCGAVQEFSEEELGNSLKRWEEKKGFKSRQVVIEVQGICELCQKN
ncbi:Fur family transcriptional regulator [Flexibacterium corallicola]|uniref:Fur family transcriptional regulator n=1 Tax=Flexibacterium corallicola TaxID=3037259 RepID=UPI00286EC254|nr:Fur family transcriptional regulator [Pseudovibrio sp. M1P-2-3]